ncbi:MAG: ribosome assembly cofactor RimP [Ginsengibacter sp.]
MATSTETEKIEEFINGFVQKWPEIFLVDVKIAPGNKITVLMDSDKGLTIENCTVINKALYHYIEETNLFGIQNFSLEVSSFGVGNPLKLLRQYQKNIGRTIEVILKDGNRLEGILLAADEENLTIEEKTGKGNKMTTTTTTILFNQIKHSTVLITF